MKTVFIGCVKFSERIVRALAAAPGIELAGIVTREASAFNADFLSLQALADAYRLPCFIDRGNRQDEMAEWLETLAPDVIFCVGWSFLLNDRVLGIAPQGVIGYHPADIPNNRGRHPIIWALALGLPQTASAFFRMTPQADAGPIVSKVAVPIAAADDAASLYEKLAACAERQVGEICRDLAGDGLTLAPQAPGAGNTWRKRGKEDGRIDWRMPAAGIHNLVRALTRPYVGAHCLHRGDEVKIWRTRPINCLQPNLEPGKVLAVEGRTIVVKTGDDAIGLVDHEFAVPPQAGEYL